MSAVHEYPVTPELHRELRRATPYDFPLLAAVVILLGLGAVMVYSATINEMTQLTGDGAGRLKTHLLHVAIGVTALVAATFFPHQRLRTLVYPALLATSVLLVLVVIAGVQAGNARRWLALPSFNFQPAELAKFVFILFLSHSLAKKAGNIRRFTVAFIPHFLVCSVLIILCLFQPDFGTSVLLVLMMFTMLFIAGTRMSYLTLFVFVGGFLAFQAVASNDMRLGRVLATIDPWAHRAGRGYQMVASQIAIGSGGTTGQGLGFGGQTLTGHLPEGENDFIISVLAEQLGTLGVLLVTVLFGIILYRGVRVALHAENPFSRYLAFGITLLLSLEAVVNMLVAVALIPTKGLTFPFVSYGGSSMLVSCFAIGVLLNISRTTGWEKVKASVPGIDTWIPEDQDAATQPPKRPRRQVETGWWQRTSRRFRRRKAPPIEEVLK
jgi:cell division protein FtsW